MRIFFLNDSQFVRRGLAAGLAQVGQETVFAGTHLWELSPAGQDAAVESWIAALPPAELLLYEGLTGGAPISPRAIRRLKEAWGARFFYWAIEDPRWTHEVLPPDGSPGPYTSVADHVFTTAVECVDRYVEAGLASSVLLFACNPEFHRPVDDSREPACEVALVADNYPDRAERQYTAVVWPALDLCRRRGWSCRVFGRWWETTPAAADAHGQLPYERLPHVYSRAKLVLGLEQCLDISATQSSSRIFEVTGCGACYLGPRHRAHARLFDEDEEVLVSDSAAETEELLTWMVEDESARTAVAARGRARCLAEHTYAHRAEQLLGVYRTSTRRGCPPE